jgi:hypothetical protein
MPPMAVTDSSVAASIAAIWAAISSVGGRGDGD